MASLLLALVVAIHMRKPIALGRVLLVLVQELLGLAIDLPLDNALAIRLPSNNLA